MYKQAEASGAWAPVHLLNARRKLRFMLDMRRLRVLCAVADQPSLSAAAETLNYTPSAVSQSIVTLEREVGTRLLHRGPRGVRLTAAGRTLVEHARPLLSGLQAAEGAVAALQGLRAGQLHLASFATAGATILPRAIARFRERYPDVYITLTQADPDQGMVKLRAGEVDLIITVDAAEVDGVEVVNLLDDPLYAVVPVTNGLADRDEVGLEELASDTWIDAPADSETRRVLLEACSQAGFIPRVAFESDEYTTIQSIVATGVGVALVPGLALASPPPGVKAIRLSGPPVVRQIQAALHATEYRAPAAGAMLDILCDVSREE